MDDRELTRREFIRRAAAGAAITGLAATKGFADEDTPVNETTATPENPADAPPPQGVPTRKLGRTGVRVSMLGLGGWHVGAVEDDKQAIRLVRTAIDSGVTFMDNAWDYHGGRSEDIMGRALGEGYREKVFLMTKHHGRKAERAREHLEDSLRRLRTDRIDLWQFHEIGSDDDVETIFGPGGGLEAAVKAREEGKVRFIGFTGHKHPKFHLKMLERDFQWDTVQMPVNVLDAHYKSFQAEVLPVLLERGIAPIGMKSMAGGHMQRLETVKPSEALRYAWSQPIATLVSGISSMDVLEANIALARRFEPMPEDERKGLLDRVRKPAAEGKYEWFKTSAYYDRYPGRAAERST